MTSPDDKARAALRAYADSIQPPPVAEVIARAEYTREDPSRTALPRSRGRLVLAAAVVAAIGAVAVAADQLRDPDPTSATQPAVVQPTASPTANRMAPGCPPGLPVLERPAASIAARRGQNLTLPVRVPAAALDRRLLSVTIYFTPPGTNMTQRGKAIAQSPVQPLLPDQQRISLIVQVPTGTAAGTYDIVGYATWPGPSLCGVTNPTDTTQVGNSWGVIGSVVIS